MNETLVTILGAWDTQPSHGEIYGILDILTLILILTNLQLMYKLLE